MTRRLRLLKIKNISYLITAIRRHRIVMTEEEVLNFLSALTHNLTDNDRVILLYRET